MQNNSNKTENIFELLYDLLEKRKNTDSQESYVASLYAKGNEKINAKIIEEAKEVCEAALKQDKKHLTHEIVDLLFHTFVLGSHHNISLKDLENEFRRRYGTSGMAEKKAREKMT